MAEVSRKQCDMCHMHVRGFLSLAIISDICLQLVQPGLLRLPWLHKMRGDWQYLEDLLLCCVKGKIAHIQRSGFPQTIFKFLLCSVKATISVLADRWVQLLHSKHDSMSDLPLYCRLRTSTCGGMEASYL